MVCVYVCVQMKSVLEEQIAQRLMSSKRDNEQRLSDEQQALRRAEQLFEKSILEEHNKKKTETALLKQEWSKQVSIPFFYSQYFTLSLPP